MQMPLVLLLCAVINNICQVWHVVVCCRFKVPIYNSFQNYGKTELFCLQCFMFNHNYNNRHFGQNHFNLSSWHGCFSGFLCLAGNLLNNINLFTWEFHTFRSEGDLRNCEALPRASHRYRRGHGFRNLIEASSFFPGLYLQLLKLLHNCEDHFHFYSSSAVHIYDLYDIHIISFIFLLCKLYVPCLTLRFEFLDYFLQLLKEKKIHENYLSRDLQ